ncbi:molybdate ABC transporter substrate-binding protein [Mangrovicoccus sp. HB161399]|uniref:molybdate ABC transporter substrate-binding protein n=1 Tax=Mangrovicoccus sp. HB161399 TaxID=2720392 RepID=UPI0015551956|nr:molybdate ABC transporter substrate-binding protein [Mangrovicoccus sp. HB161399]
MTFHRLASLGAGPLLAALLLGTAASAAETTVAVAANFTAAAQEIGTAFEAETGHQVTFSFGSTGQLFTQISQGAPFDVFLAADQARPEKAGADGLADPATRFTYATGKLVLWSATPGLVDAGPEVLETGAVTHVAIANPSAAPYGAAAVEAIAALGMEEALAPKLVEGQSISQTYQFAVTGNAEAGFVALAQLAGQDDGSAWMVPEDLYAPIRQDAVLLSRGEGNEAAEAFLAFLKGPAAQEIIEEYGYGFGG